MRSRMRRRVTQPRNCSPSSDMSGPSYSLVTSYEETSASITHNNTLGKVFCLKCTENAQGYCFYCLDPLPRVNLAFTYRFTVGRGSHSERLLVPVGAGGKVGGGRELAPLSFGHHSLTLLIV